MQQVIDETYKKSVAQRHKRKEEHRDYVKEYLCTLYRKRR